MFSFLGLMSYYIFTIRLKPYKHIKLNEAGKITIIVMLLNVGCAIISHEIYKINVDI